MKRHEKQRLFQVLIGEECGTLACDTNPKPIPADYGQMA